jgi:hypothetical protein
VSAEKPYQYQYAQRMASDLFMLSEIMKAIATNTMRMSSSRRLRSAGRGRERTSPCITCGRLRSSLPRMSTGTNMWCGHIEGSGGPGSWQVWPQAGEAMPLEDSLAAGRHLRAILAGCHA